MSQTSQTGSNYFDGVPIGKVQIRFLILAVMGYFFEQMDLFTFSFAAPALTKHWGVSLEWIGMVNSLTFMGMLVGCWCGGWISDQIGRKKSFLISIAIFSFASIANGLAPNQTIFIIARTLTGFGALFMVVVAMVYMAEMLPSESRGKWQGLSMAIGLMGVPLSGQLAQRIIPASPDGWRYVFFLGGLGIIGCILVYFWLKESPRWLVSKGRIAEAEKIIQEIAPGHKVDLSKESGKPLSERKTSFKDVMIMFSKTYSRRTWVMVSLSCGITVGCFAFFAWMPTLLNEYGYSMEESLFMAALVAFGAPIGDFVAAMLADKGGRKIPTVAYCLVIGFLTILFGLVKVPALIIGVGFLIRMLVEGAFIFLWVYLAESFPTNIRNTASGLIYGTGRLLTAGAMLLIPVIFTKYGYSVLFTIIGAMFIIPGVITWIWGERTAGKSLEEINQDDTEEAISSQKTVSVEA